MPLNCTLKVVKMVKFMLYIFYHKNLKKKTILRQDLHLGDLKRVDVDCKSPDRDNDVWGSEAGAGYVGRERALCCPGSPQSWHTGASSLPVFGSEKKIGRKADVEAWVGGTSLGLQFGQLGAIRRRRERAVLCNFTWRCPDVF